MRVVGWPGWVALAAALLGPILLGGCLGNTGSPATQPHTPDPRSPVSGAFDDETGALEGLVVDEELRPVAEASVTINETGASAVTNEVGSFAFSYLQPGRYTLWAQRDGYIAGANTFQAVAGASTTARLVIAVDASALPYQVHEEFRGFYSCSVAVVVGVPNCNGLGVDAFGQQTISYAFDIFDAWDEAVIELRWEYSSALAATTPGAFFSNHALVDNESAVRCLGDVYGEESPIVKRFRPGDAYGGENCSSVVANSTGLVPDAAYLHSVNFAPWGMLHNETQPVVDLLGNAQSRGVGVAFSQHFTAWFSAFYRSEAPAEFTAFPDE